MYECMHACMHVCMYVCMYVCREVYLIDLSPLRLCRTNEINLTGYESQDQLAMYDRSQGVEQGTT